LLDRAAWARAHEAQRAVLAAALDRFPVDVVHLHGVDFDRYLPPPGPPALVTLHLPAEAYRPEALRPARPRTYLHCVSRSQRERFPSGLPLLPVIENGVDLRRFRPARRTHRYALALGRICAMKGTDLALEAAARARVPMLVAGMVHPFPEHLRFFEEAVRPRLGRGGRYLGPVSGDPKLRLLAGAACLVVASRAAETCSLVTLEALASATPVVALEHGALPDLVDNGRTGFLCGSVEELAQGIAAVHTLERAACRAAAEARFSMARTMRRYLERYQELVASG
jgi:glycosyltransferase involved in cell wall biosynthesis